MCNLTNLVMSFNGRGYRASWWKIRCVRYFYKWGVACFENDAHD